MGETGSVLTSKTHNVTFAFLLLCRGSTASGAPPAVRSTPTPAKLLLRSLSFVQVAPRGACLDRGALAILPHQMQERPVERASTPTPTLAGTTRGGSIGEVAHRRIGGELGTNYCAGITYDTYTTATVASRERSRVASARRSTR